MDNIIFISSFTHIHTHYLPNPMNPIPFRISNDTLWHLLWRVQGTRFELSPGNMKLCKKKSDVLKQSFLSKKCWGSIPSNYNQFWNWDPTGQVEIYLPQAQVRIWFIRNVYFLWKTIQYDKWILLLILKQIIPKMAENVVSFSSYLSTLAIYFRLARDILGYYALLWRSASFLIFNNVISEATWGCCMQFHLPIFFHSPTHPDPIQSLSPNKLRMSSYASLTFNWMMEMEFFCSRRDDKDIFYWDLNYHTKLLQINVGQRRPWVNHKWYLFSLVCYCYMHSCFDQTILKHVKKISIPSIKKDKAV